MNKEKIILTRSFWLERCQNDRSTISDDIKIEAQLLFFDTLNFYAQQYRSVKTYENIVASFESNDLKQKLFCKFPVKAKLTYAETLFQYYSLVKNEEPVFSFEKTNLLIKAKYYLWTLYMHHIDGKTKLNNRELSQCLTILAFCLGELSRWFEPLYYLEKARSQLPENPNVSYARALILKTVKEKTCLNYNAVLVLAIIDYCRDAMSSSVILLQQRDQLKMLEAGERKFLTTQKQSIAKIRAHRLKIDRVYRTYNAYKKFCVDEQLFINEHSFFCNCAKATSDSLRVETKHQHTRIDWAKQFEVLIDMFVADFALARKNYYHSLDGTKIPELITKRHRRYTHDKEEKVALLKNSFRTLYSLLDRSPQLLV